MSRRTAKTYQGKKCPDCKTTERYQSNGKCVACYRAAKKATSEKAVTTGMPRPSPPKREKGWRKFMAEDGTIIPADPIAVMMNQGFE